MNKLRGLFKKVIQNEILWIILILIGAFSVRLYKIDTPLADWHSFRQADTASVTRTYVERGINVLYPRYHDISSIQSGINNPEGYRFVEFPAYNVIHALLIKVFPVYSLEVWGRLLSIICSLVTTLLVYLLGKRYIGKWGGIISAFCFAFLPYNIFYSRVILPEPMATMFGVSAVWLFSQFIDRNKVTILYLSGVVFLLSLLIKPFTIFYAAPMLYLLIEKHGFKPIFKNGKLVIKLLIFSNIILVPFLLWRYWLTLYPAGVPLYAWILNGDGIRFRPAFWRWIFGDRLGRLILGFWGLIPFSLGVVKSEAKNRFVQFFLLGIFLYFSVVATGNVRHDYYQTLAIPAIALAVGSGANFLLTSKELARRLSIGLVIFSFGMMLGMGWYQVKDYYSINHPEIIEAGEAIDALAPKDALVIAPYNGDTAFLYQTKRWGWPVIDTDIDSIIARGADYYVSVNYDDQTNAYMKRFETVTANPRYVILDLHKKIK